MWYNFGNEDFEVEAIFGSGGSARGGGSVVDFEPEKL